MNETHADLGVKVESATGKESSESGAMHIFTTELGRLKRIVAGMGLDAPDGEDVLQDVSIRALSNQQRSKIRKIAFAG